MICPTILGRGAISDVKYIANSLALHTYLLSSRGVGQVINITFAQHFHQKSEHNRRYVMCSTQSLSIYLKPLIAAPTFCTADTNRMWTPGLIPPFTAQQCSTVVPRT
ncbi:hypothetical protein AVEN_153702-1 [Araneus ventricosus]|uniref:Uncharacterized protein n=1 Tax=Araneus ventricosus TaxID=182803 RepID=A0A4Y2G2B8_ARAVE|nr:hypothetical protein AVEN_153702-1 [Araneus ventricosus]